MDRHSPSRRLALWGAWVLAPAAGILVAQPFRADDRFAFHIFVLPAICIALFQSLVLCVLVGEASLRALLWMPASAGTVFLGTFTYAIYPAVMRAYPDIPRPPEFFTASDIFWGFAAVAALLQGIVLARLFNRWSIAGLWFAASVLALVAAFLPGPFGNFVDDFWLLVADALDDRGYGAFSAAVFMMYLLMFISVLTGVVLISLSRRKKEVPRRVAT